MFNNKGKLQADYTLLSKGTDEKKSTTRRSFIAESTKKAIKQALAVQDTKPKIVFLPEAEPKLRAAFLLHFFNIARQEAKQQFKAPIIKASRCTDSTYIAYNIIMLSSLLTISLVYIYRSKFEHHEPDSEACYSDKIRQFHDDVYVYVTMGLLLIWTLTARLKELTVDYLACLPLERFEVHKEYTPPTNTGLTRPRPSKDNFNPISTFKDETKWIDDHTFDNYCLSGSSPRPQFNNERWRSDLLRDAQTAWDSEREEREAFQDRIERDQREWPKKQQINAKMNCVCNIFLTLETFSFIAGMTLPAYFYHEMVAYGKRINSDYENGLCRQRYYLAYIFFIAIIIKTFINIRSLDPVKEYFERYARITEKEAAPLKLIISLIVRNKQVTKESYSSHFYNTMQALKGFIHQYESIDSTVKNHQMTMFPSIQGIFAKKSVASLEEHEVHELYDSIKDNFFNSDSSQSFSA